MRKYHFLIIGISLIFTHLGFASPQDSALVPLPCFNWSKHLNIPPNAQDTKIQEQGFQVLHFNTKNRSYLLSENAINFVNAHFQDAKEVHSDSQVLLEGCLNVTVEGFFIEAGSCTGRTTNFIAALNPNKTIYGFDCFEGLPEDWVREDRIFEKGTFALKDLDNFSIPVLDNVTLYKGLFEDVLPLFKEEILKDFPISFLHIDSDTYNACKDVLTILCHNFVSGTIIVFDEFYNYPGFENHEWKAFSEFLENSDFNVEFIAFNSNHEQVAIRLRARKNK